LLGNTKEKNSLSGVFFLPVIIDLFNKRVIIISNFHPLKTRTMANISKLTKERKSVFEQFFLIGLPFRIVAEAMDINPVTAKKYFAKLMRKDWEIVRGRAASQLRMLELYSSWVSDPKEFKLIAGGTKKNLLEILWRELEMDMFQTLIIGVLGTVEFFCKPQFERGISENEQKFITEYLTQTIYVKDWVQKIPPGKANARNMIARIMEELHSGGIAFPTQEEFSKKHECFLRLIQSYLPFFKERVMPVVTYNMCSLLRSVVTETGALQNLTVQEQTVLEHAYKLGWFGKVDVRKLDVTEDRLRKIRHQALAKLRSTSSVNKIIFPFEIQNDVLEALRQDIKVVEGMVEQEKQKFLERGLELARHKELVQKARLKGFLTEDEIKELENKQANIFNEVDIKLLRTPIEDLNLSVRAYHCCKRNKIRTLADLAQSTSADLLQFRNCGKKTLTELEAILAARGLHFGTVFSPTDEELLFTY
jgi:hypothetical protein